jgi:hypothetical protein
VRQLASTQFRVSQVDGESRTDSTGPGYNRIDRRAAALAKARDLFEAHTAAQPPDVATAAHAYVNLGARKMRKLEAPAYTQADGVVGDVALARLNQLCHIGYHGMTPITCQWLLPRIWPPKTLCSQLRPLVAVTAYLDLWPLLLLFTPTRTMRRY